MRSILLDAQTFYSDFFEKDTWSEEGANRILHGKSQIEYRKKVVKFAYKVIIDNTKINEAVKDFVRLNKSLSNTAELRGISLSRMKNMYNYANKTLTEDLSLDEVNYIHLMLYQDEIEIESWKKISANIQLVKIKRGKYIYGRKPLIENRDILVNIPSREYNTELEKNSDWNYFIQTIKPYFISERKKVQERINTEFKKEAGYLNYLITPGIKMTPEDKARYSELKKMLGADNEIIQSIDKAKKEDSLAQFMEKEEAREKEEAEQEEKEMKKIDPEELSRMKKEIEETPTSELYKPSKHIQYNF